MLTKWRLLFIKFSGRPFILNGPILHAHSFRFNDNDDYYYTSGICTTQPIIIFATNLKYKGKTFVWTAMD